MENKLMDLPGDPGVKNLPADAGDKAWNLVQEDSTG